jgi:hypothetical protein
MKIPGICFPYDVWYNVAKGDNRSVSWVGHGLWTAIDLMYMMGKNQSHLELVTELSTSTTTHPMLQTVIDGRVDFAPLEVGMTSQRYKVLDYSHAIIFTGPVIISRQIEPSMSGNFVAEIFDMATVLCMLASMVLMILIVWFSNYLATDVIGTEDENCHRYSFASIFFYSIGAAFSQGFPAKMKMGSQATSLAAMHCFVAMILTTIFSGLVVVKLLAKNEHKHVETALADLRVNTHLGILVKPNSYVDDIMDGPSKIDLKTRIEYLDVDRVSQPLHVS